MFIKISLKLGFLICARVKIWITASVCDKKYVQLIKKLSTKAKVYFFANEIIPGHIMF